jgi:hypothetical protein
VDTAGSAYLIGGTTSTDFPTTPSAFDTSYNGGGDAFVTKLNGSGSALAFSTFLGGSFADGLGSIAVDAAGSAYVSGMTNSVDFPTTPGAYDTSHNGNNDAFLTRLNASGSALSYGTFLGGWDGEGGWSMAANNAGGVHLTGGTSSTDFPTTPGAYDTSYNGPVDIFVARLETAAPTALTLSTLDVAGRLRYTFAWGDLFTARKHLGAPGRR